MSKDDFVVDGVRYEVHNVTKLAEQIVAVGLHADQLSAEAVCLRVRSHPDPEIRRRAIMALGYSARGNQAISGEARQWLLEQRKSADPDVRWEADNSLNTVHFHVDRRDQPPRPNDLEFIRKLAERFDLVKHWRDNLISLGESPRFIFAHVAADLMGAARSGGPAPKEMRAFLDALEESYVSNEEIRPLIREGFLHNLWGPPVEGWQARAWLGPALRRDIERMWPSDAD